MVTTTGVVMLFRGLEPLSTIQNVEGQIIDHPDQSRVKIKLLKLISIDGWSWDGPPEQYDSWNSWPHHRGKKPKGEWIPPQWAKWLYEEIH